MESSVRTIPCNDSLSGIAEMLPDIVYSTATGEDLKLSLLRKWVTPEDKPCPLLVFVQGSAWTFPNVYYEIPQLSWYAQHGYVVATVTHRNCLEGHPFPAYLQDVKTAIRFLRKNAAQYNIDPNRVAIWGTSSGGNTAMLVALTGNDPRYRTEEYADIDDSVKAMVQCFGPTDIPEMIRLQAEKRGMTLQEAIENDFLQKEDLGSFFVALSGGDPRRNWHLLEEMSPIYHVEECKAFPPMLMLQGGADPVVPYTQCSSMYERLLKVNAPVEMVCVEGAVHEGNFWSEELHGIIRDFIAKNL